MTKIKPISIWQNGQTIKFDNIDIHINFDDLSSKAVFYYCLNNDDKNRIEGNINIEDQEYQNWTGENDETIKLVVQKLGLELA